MALHVGDDEYTVVENRKRFLDSYALNIQNLICLDQTHSSNVTVISRESAGAGAFSHDKAIKNCDAIITAEKDLILGIMTADCVPIVLFDNNKGVVAAVHAGWRGTAGGIVKKTATMMVEDFGCAPQNINAKIFPSIDKCCYEVGDDTAAQCGCGGENRLDLQRLNFEQLTLLAIPKENIEIDKTCTACGDKNLYSYRADGGTTGRFMSFIVMKDIG